MPISGTRLPQMESWRNLPRLLCDLDRLGQHQTPGFELRTAKESVSAREETINPLSDVEPSSFGRAVVPFLPRLVAAGLSRRRHGWTHIIPMGPRACSLLGCDHLHGWNVHCT